MAIPVGTSTAVITTIATAETMACVRCSRQMR